MRVRTSRFTLVADLVKHAANLAIQTLVQNDAQPSRPDRLQAGQSGAFAVEKNPVDQFLTQFWVPMPIERNLLLLLYLVARMGELLGEIAITRQEKQPLCLSVEPADAKKTREFCRQQIVNRVGCIRVAAGGNEPGGFVQRDGEIFRSPDDPVIDLDVIALLHLRPKVGAMLAVDRYTAGRYQFITMPARTKPSSGEEAIKAQGKLRG